MGNASTGTKINVSYWNTETTGQTRSAGGAGRTTKQMKTKATYPSSWNFNTVWKIEEGVSYPSLINNPERH